MNDSGNGGPSHAFISYVREDAERVDRLQAILEAAGVKVWRDTDNLWPGQDWKIEINRAITSESLAFIACFSENTERRSKSYQNEELILAVDQMRLRTPGQSWLIPVRFSDCTVPAFDLGAGRTLNSIQRVDLFDDSWERGAAKLAATVIRILGLGSVSRSAAPATPSSIASQIKSKLLASDKQIELEEFVSQTISDVRAIIIDEGTFPVNSELLNGTVGGARFLIQQANAYHSAAKPLVSILVPGCRWGRKEHDQLWTRVLREVVNADKRRSGKSALLALERLPALIAFYAAGIAALSSNNFGSMRSVSVDPIYRSSTGPVPLISAVNPFGIFEDDGVTANILAREADGANVTDAEIEQLMRRTGQRRKTPASDYLQEILRPSFSNIVDGEDFGDLFDDFEGFIGLIATDIMLQGRATGQYLRGAWFGRFIWHAGTPIEERLSSKINAEGENWAPLEAGLFGGSAERAQAAAQQFVADAAGYRQRLFWA